MITPKNLVKHEIIGLHVEVMESPNKIQIGMRGNVVFETKNMIMIKIGDKIKKIQKEKSVFIFKLPDGKKIKINGDILKKRPEDRVKIELKKW